MSGLVRTGRGGAGNFLSQKDVEEAAQAQRDNVRSDEASRLATDSRESFLIQKGQDPEAQRPLAPASASHAGHAPQYVRSGRGGAGNFAEPPTAAESQTREDVVDRTEAAVNASQAGKPRAGLSGRGGAGNWTDGAAAHDGDADNVQSKQAQIEDMVVHDIEASLPPPPKTYHQHDRDMQK